GRGRVAGDDEQLRAAVEQVRDQALDPGTQPGGRLGAVREAFRVAEIDVVLLRERDEQLVEHREPTDSGVEHGDREGPAGVTHAGASSPVCSAARSIATHPERTRVWRGARWHRANAARMPSTSSSVNPEQ